MSTFDYKKVSINTHLIDAGFRFIKVTARDKDAFETGWTKYANYSGKDKELLNHLENGGNYGVMGSRHHLIIDADREEITSLVLKLPETFTVRSGSGRGLHAYFLCENEENITLINPDNPLENWGNIQTAGKMVVGPGSIHPSGGTYDVIKDIPVSKITLGEIKEVFGKYIKKREKVDPDEVRRSYGSHSGLFDQINLGDVGCWPIKAVDRGNGEYQGEHPIHGSSTGQNFSVNPHKNTWHCFRGDGSGGGPLEWVALQEGIISCEDAKPGCLRGENFTKVLEILKERGIELKLPKKTPPERPLILPLGDQFDLGETKEDPFICEHIPDEIPEEEVVHVDAPPRYGKSHKIVGDWISTQTKSANVITTSHSIIEHHLRIFKANKTPDATAVHLEGKERCCLLKNKSEPCKLCTHYPFEGDNYPEVQAFARNLLYGKKVLTKENVEGDWCPYYIIKQAEPMADYCFTVVANLLHVSPRPVTFFDEDPTISQFFASSAKIMEATFHAHHISATSTVEEKWAGVVKYKKYLETHRPKGKKTILRVIEILEQMRPTLNLENMSRETKHNIVGELVKIDTKIDQPDDIEPYELIENVKRFEMNECLSPYLEALLFQYNKQRFIWTGNNPSTLHLVADEEKIIRPAPDGKIIIVGSTRAELFIKALKRNYKIIRIPTFPYADKFAIIVLKEDSKKSSRKSMEKILKDMGKVNEETRFPLLVLTGSEKDQHRLKMVLGGIAHSSKDENEVGQKWNHKSGMINIFYQNSVISRGIDVDFYNFLFVYSSDFANPYWSARLAVARDEHDDVDADYVQKVLDYIVMDETTNSVLRISPVRSTTDNIPRVVVISEHDFWKIRPNVSDDIKKISVTADFFDARVCKILAEGRTRTLHERALPGTQILEMKDEDVGNSNSGSVCKIDQGLSLTQKINSCPDLEIETFLKRLENSDFRANRFWRNNHNVIDLENVEADIRKYLQRSSIRNRRSSEMALSRYINSNAPKSKKNAYAVENILRIVADMVRSGEIIREGGMGPNSLLSLRERYVAPEIEEGEGFKI